MLLAILGSLSHVGLEIGLVMWYIVPSSSVQSLSITRSCLSWEALYGWCSARTEPSRLSCDQHSFIGGSRGVHY